MGPGGRRELAHVLVVGLGNHTYPNTRHSLGMTLLNRIAQELPGSPQWKMDRSLGGWILQTTASDLLVSTSSSVVSGGDRVSTPIPEYDLTPSQRKLQRQQKRYQQRKDGGSGVKPSLVLSPGVSIDGGIDTGDANGAHEPARSPSRKRPHSPSPSPSPPPPEHTPPSTRTITFLKPREPMNMSGLSVFKAMKSLHIPISNCIVVHDDLERRLGALSVKSGGSANGHNGIRSIISSTHTQHFLRIRAGIGKPESDTASIADYVLDPFTASETHVLDTVVVSGFRQLLLDVVQCDDPLFPWTPKNKKN